MEAFDSQQQADMYGTSSNLSKLFALDNERVDSDTNPFSNGSTGGSSLLRYERPKEPIATNNNRKDSVQTAQSTDTEKSLPETCGETKQNTSESGNNSAKKKSIVYSLAVQLFKWDGKMSSFQSLSASPCGCVILGDGVDKYQLLIYDSGKKPQCTVKIDSDFDCALNGSQSYLKFRSSHLEDGVWYCLGASAESVLVLLRLFLVLKLLSPCEHEGDGNEMEDVELKLPEFGDRESEPLVAGDIVGVNLSYWVVKAVKDVVFQNPFLEKPEQPFEETVVRLTLGATSFPNGSTPQLAEKFVPGIHSKLIGLQKCSKMYYARKKADTNEVVFVEINILKVKKRRPQPDLKQEKQDVDRPDSGQIYDLVPVPDKEKGKEKDKEKVGDSPVDKSVSTNNENFSDTKEQNESAPVQVIKDTRITTSLENSNGELLKSLSAKVDLLLERKHQIESHGSVLGAVENIIRLNEDLKQMVEQKDATIMNLKMKVNESIESRTELLERCAQANRKQREAESQIEQASEKQKRKLKKIMGVVFEDLEIDPEQSYTGKELINIVKNCMKECYTRISYPD